MMTATISERTYANEGNGPLLDLLDANCVTILDVGCGAGDNARLLRQRGFSEIYGITLSPLEYERAAPEMRQCWIRDIEASSLDFLNGIRFDAIIFSHVLEHLREPELVLERFVRFLNKDGNILIAVPNVVYWLQRIQFLLGGFDYTQEGIMDSTHLRFFSYNSADKYLIRDGMQTVCKQVTGKVPLWLLRRYVFPAWLSRRVDEIGCSLLPNFFGFQILIKARLRAPAPEGVTPSRI